MKNYYTKQVGFFGCRRFCANVCRALNGGTVCFNDCLSCSRRDFFNDARKRASKGKGKR